jgi:hypothetical protein
MSMPDGRVIPIHFDGSDVIGTDFAARKCRLDFLGSFFGPGLRRNHPGIAVIHREVAVDFAGVFDQAFGEITKANLLLAGMGRVVETERIDDWSDNSCVTFCFDGSSAIGKRFLDVSDQLGLALEPGARRIFFAGRFLANGEIREVIIRGGGMDEALGESARAGLGFEVELGLGEIFGHGDKLSADFIPLQKHSF